MGRVNVDYSMSVLGLQTDFESRSRNFRLPPGVLDLPDVLEAARIFDVHHGWLK